MYSSGQSSKTFMQPVMSDILVMYWSWFICATGKRRVYLVGSQTSWRGHCYYSATFSYHGKSVVSCSTWSL